MISRATKYYPKGIIMTTRTIRAFILTLIQEGADSDKEIINDDIVFEIELVRQIEVNIDYILCW